MTPSSSTPTPVCGRGLLATPWGGAWILWGWIPGVKPLPLPLAVTGYQVEKKLAVAVAVADPDCLKASVKQEVLLNRKAVLYRVRTPESRYRALAAVPLGTVSGKPQILSSPL